MIQPFSALGTERMNKSSYRLGCACTWIGADQCRVDRNRRAHLTAFHAGQKKRSTKEERSLWCLSAGFAEESEDDEDEVYVIYRDQTGEAGMALQVEPL